MIVIFLNNFITDLSKAVHLLRSVFVGFRVCLIGMCAVPCCTHFLCGCPRRVVLSGRALS